MTADKALTDMQCDIACVHKLHWRGVLIQIHRTSRRFGDLDHLEIKVISDDIIPITDTGYRSHFLKPEHFEDYGGINPYVTAWLNDAAQSSDWQKLKTERSQLSLF